SRLWLIYHGLPGYRVAGLPGKPGKPGTWKPGNRQLSLHRRFGFAIEFAAFLALAFIEKLLAADDGDLRLHPSALEVKAQRHNRQPLLDDLSLELVDFPAVEQELSLPFGFVILAIAVGVRRDMDADQPRLAPVDVHVAVLQIHLGFAQGLHLGAGQSDA